MGKAEEYREGLPDTPEARKTTYFRLYELLVAVAEGWESVRKDVDMVAAINRALELSPEGARLFLRVASRVYILIAKAFQDEGAMSDLLLADMRSPVLASKEKEGRQ